jgi:hypothetical protein
MWKFTSRAFRHGRSDLISAFIATFQCGTRLRDVTSGFGAHLFINTAYDILNFSFADEPVVKKHQNCTTISTLICEVV